MQKNINNNQANTCRSVYKILFPFPPVPVHKMCTKHAGWGRVELFTSNTLRVPSLMQQAWHQSPCNPNVSTMVAVFKCMWKKSVVGAWVHKVSCGSAHLHCRVWPYNVHKQLSCGGTQNWLVVGKRIQMCPGPGLLWEYYQVLSQGKTAQVCINNHTKHLWMFREW